jgi:hypothetical protein
VGRIGEHAVVADTSTGLSLAIQVDYTLILNMLLEIGVEDPGRCNHAYCVAKRQLSNVTPLKPKNGPLFDPGTMGSWLHDPLHHIMFNQAVHEVLLSRDGLVSRLGMLLGDLARCQPAERDLPKGVEWHQRRGYIKKIWNDFLVVPHSPMCK